MSEREKEDFHLTRVESQKLIEKIASEFDSAIWQTAGEVLEGSVQDAVRADELRAKADKIERGEPE